MINQKSSMNQGCFMIKIQSNALNNKEASIFYTFAIPFYEGGKRKHIQHL